PGIAGPHRLRVGAVLPRNERAPHQAAVDDRRHRLSSLPQLGAGLLGPLGDHRVELVTGDHVAVGGEARYGRPLELEGPTEGDRPQTDEAVVAGQPVGQAHVVELLDGPWGQPVAAGLLPGEPLLLDQQDVVPGVGQPVRAGRAGRAGPDDEDVVVGHQALEVVALVVHDCLDLCVGEYALPRRHATRLRDPLAAGPVRGAVALALHTG